MLVKDITQNLTQTDKIRVLYDDERFLSSIQLLPTYLLERHVVEFKYNFTAHQWEFEL